MGQKAITIYTPATTPPHINAEDDAQVYRAIFGQASGIAEGDSQLACTVVNDNTVRLASGTFVNQGYLVCVPGGQTEDFAIPSGTQAMYRKDLLIAEFTRGGGDVPDTHVFRMLTGTAASSEASAAAPTLVQNDLSAGGSLRQEALYQVLVSGTTISSIMQVARLVGNVYQ